MRIIEETDGRIFYVEVEANYKVPEEGIGQKDAVNFVMGQYKLIDRQEQDHECDSLISVSTSDARRFAEQVIALCDFIDGQV